MRPRLLGLAAVTTGLATLHTRSLPFAIACAAFTLAALATWKGEPPS